jgi:hypothetical protein
MLTGKRFRITRSTVGVQLVDDTARIVTVPIDGIIKVLSGPNHNAKLHDKGLVYVLWEEQTVALFAVDVEARGIEIEEQSATA